MQCHDLHQCFFRRKAPHICSICPLIVTRTHKILCRKPENNLTGGTVRQSIPPVCYGMRRKRKKFTVSCTLRITRSCYKKKTKLISKVLSLIFILIVFSPPTPRGTFVLQKYLSICIKTGFLNRPLKGFEIHEGFRTL